MSIVLQRSRVTRIALLSTLAVAGITSTMVGSASADGDTITNPPRPTHRCWDTPGAFGCMDQDGSGFECVYVGTETPNCYEWDSEGNHTQL